MKTKFTFLAIMLALFGLSKNANAQWVQANTGITGNNINAMAAIGTNIFAGSSKGLFMSSDNGNSWIPSSDINLYDGSTEVTALVTMGTNIFAGVEGKGVFLSTDNGNTWTGVNTSLTYQYPGALATLGNTIYASMNFEGLFYSTDIGTTWTKYTAAPFADTRVTSIVTNGSNILAGTNKNSKGVFLSTDGGSTWTAVNNGLTGSINVTALAKIGTTIFAAMGNPGVFKTTDNGSNWSLTTTSPVDNAITLAVLGSNLIVGAPNGTYSSTDNGTTWSDISANAGFTNLSVTSFAINSTDIFAGNIYHTVGVYKRPLSDFGVTGIEKNSSENSFVLLPNPSTGKFTVEFTNKHQVVNIIIYNMLGEKILQQQTSNEIDISTSKKGIYIVKVYDGEKIYNKKIIIQ